MSTDCAVEGNADLYGLGIRIGFYLQTLGTSIVVFLDRRDLRHLDVGTVWFFIALFVALCYHSAHGTIYVGEALIASHLLTIVFWYQVSLSVFILGASGRFLTMPSLEWDNLTQTYLIWYCSLAKESYLAWFWWRGLDNLPHSPCGDMGFFFVRADIHGWYRIIGRFFNIYALIQCVAPLVIAPIALLMVREDDIPSTRASSQQSSRIEEADMDHGGEHISSHRMETISPVHCGPDDAVVAGLAPTQAPSDQVIIGPVENDPTPQLPVPANQHVEVFNLEFPSREGALMNPDISKSKDTSRSLLPSMVTRSPRNSEADGPSRPCSEARRSRHESDTSLHRGTDVERQSTSGEDQHFRDHTNSIMDLSFGISAWLFLVAIFVYSAFAIESSIGWNYFQNVNDLTAVGQLIPLVVGLGTMVQAIRKILRRMIPKPLKKAISKAFIDWRGRLGGHV